jgi:tetratricopeptide (TPR) repeat protein
MAPVLPTWDDEASRADRQRELAERFAAAGYPEEAERAWRRALDLRQARASAAPGDRGARRMLALEHERFGRFLKDRGKPGEATILWQTALDLLAETGPETDPADPPDSAAARVELCNNLAWLLANGPDRDSRDPARAVALALTAVEAEPGSATYWNTLGVSHYRAGDSRAAIDALGRAVALGSRGTGFDHLFLAMAHASLGNDAPARDWLRRAETWINSQQSDHFELRQLREEAEDLLRLRSSG